MRLAALCLICLSTPSGAAGPVDLWAALQHATGFTDDELGHLAEELMQLAAPSQKSLWQEKVRCEKGHCAPEAVSRLVAQLGEVGRLPARVFELFPGDPLYHYWKESDKTPFHSWVDATEPEEGNIESLIPEGQPLASGRIQAAKFTWEAVALIKKLLGPVGSVRLLHSLGRCLEWDTPHYIIKAFYSMCLKYDILQYANPVAGLEEKMDVYGQGTRVLSLDVLRPPDWMPKDYGLVLCYFVLEHVPDPHQAMKGIVQLLLPGGFLLLGAPFIDGVHGCPDDYFRYTPHGLRKVAEFAGLEVLMESSPGHQIAAAGELMGMRSSYWRQEDLLQDSDTHPMNVYSTEFLVARKPLRPGHRRPWTQHNRSS